jgi:phospholipid/cholesterol/gamma-HCH transport system substrate-binding protein
VKIRKEVKVGVVTAIAIACFLYGFNFLKGKNFFKKQRIFYAVYDDIDGLVTANPLLINGFNVGMVGAIKLDPKRKGKVIVSLVVEDEIPIPFNSVAKVVSSDILGSKAVTLLLGSSPSPASVGDTLLSDQEDNLKQAVNKTIAPLQQKAQKLIGSIDSVMVVIQQVFNDNTKKNLAKSFESIKDAIGSLETTSFRLDTMVVTEKVKISSILTKVNKLATTLADNSEKLSNVINNFSNISDTIAKSNLKSAINNADVALREAASVMSKINKGEGTMGMLVNDNKLYVKLDSSSVQLERLLKDLRMNPERYVHVSVFGRKDKHKPKY